MIFSCLWAVVFDNLFCVNWALKIVKDYRPKTGKDQEILSESG